MNIDDIDLSAFRAVWECRRRAAAAVRMRTDPEGMTRPARDPDERAFLREIGDEGPFREVDRPGWREWRSGNRP
ncbi:MAG TPA: hypothetical protein VHG91_21360 [Longimicrobium sp.]|nr:hypothetical protein [Longimicrobium sp.]